ncbi:hypothetical protein G7Y89_g8418 [Cudoniella acicularis]|uniref:Uncharacterized protein n=1 Tax=Cudoniella acicularis TaxID=354080 RepID=A0A8H4RGM5_9HELO|nr:hypothetical protein G7Y89_g8418 [Cudoniella acicularis]
MHFSRIAVTALAVTLSGLATAHPSDDSLEARDTGCDKLAKDTDKLPFNFTLEVILINGSLANKKYNIALEG